LKKKLLFAVVVLFLVLGGAELVARRLPSEPVPPRGIVMPPHPTRGWTLAEPTISMKLYHATADGLRRPADEGPEGAPLVLTTGDSSIFGDGHPDGLTIHDQLHAKLNASVPSRVATLGVPGYSTEQTRVVLDEVGWDLSPRLLVVGNVWSDSNTERLRDRDLLDAASSIFGRAELLLSDSALFYQVRARINAARGLPARRKVTWPVLGATGLRRVPLADYAGNLAAILNGAAGRGVGVVVLALTNEVKLNGAQGQQPWDPYFDVQRRAAEAHGVPIVDATRVLAGSTPSSVLHDNLHPNQAGAERIAAALATAILDAGWPGATPVPGEAAPVSTGADTWDGREKPNDRSAVRDALEADPI